MCESENCIAKLKKTILDNLPESAAAFYSMERRICADKSGIAAYVADATHCCDAILALAGQNFVESVGSWTSVFYDFCAAALVYNPQRAQMAAPAI